MNRNQILKLIILRNLIALPIVLAIMWFSFFLPATGVASIGEMVPIFSRTLVLLLLTAVNLSLAFLPFFARAGGVTVVDYWRRTIPKPHNNAATGKDPYILEE